MKLILAGLPAIFCALFCSAQETTPAVTNMAGFDGIQAGSVVTMSIGEPAVSTLVQSDAIITQGFLQPEILPCVDVAFSYYPNPVITDVTIEAYGCETRIESLEVLNLWGQVLLAAAPHKDNKIMLDGLSQAIYLIKVNLSSGVTKTIKIVKVAP